MNGQYFTNVLSLFSDFSNVVYEKKIVPGKTLVVFDEIQDCPRAIQSLKYFCENIPELHIIAAGSLLGGASKRRHFFPSWQGGSYRNVSNEL